MLETAVSTICVYSKSWPAAGKVSPPFWKQANVLSTMTTTAVSRMLPTSEYSQNLITKRKVAAYQELPNCFYAQVTSVPRVLLCVPLQP